MTIWHIRIAYWIPKATNTYSEYVKITDFLLQQWLHKCASTLCFTYSASLSQDNCFQSCFSQSEPLEEGANMKHSLTTVSVCITFLVFRK
jgi:hypothetical protein